MEITMEVDRMSNDKKRVVAKKTKTGKQGTVSKKGSVHKKKKTSKGKKALRIAIIVVMVLVILLMGALFAIKMIADYYSGMLNYVDPDKNPDITLGYDETLPPEEDDIQETGTDSPPEIQIEVDNILESIANGEVDFPVVEPSKDITNILLIGIDSRSNNSSGRSDVMMILSINNESKQITVTSLMRDIYVAIPGRSNNRLNAAHAYGGGQLLMDTIELNFGVKVDGFVRVNFFNFIDIVEAAGGVDVAIEGSPTEGEMKWVNHYLSSLNHQTSGAYAQFLASDYLKEGQTGIQHLNGRQALAYARIRYVGSDYARTARQREIIMGVLNQMRQMSLSELNTFLQTVLPMVSTNLPQDMINNLMYSSPTMLGYTFQQHRVPADGTGQGVRIDGKSVISIDFAANRQLLKDIISGK